MKIKFTNEHFSNISKILAAEPELNPQGCTWTIKHPTTGLELILSIFNDIDFDSNTKGAIVSVQTVHGFFELHDVSNYLIFEPDEVFFIKSDETHVSTLVVGKNCSCSLYSNIKRSMLNKDFNELDTPLLLAAMQLAIAESTK